MGLKRERTEMNVTYIGFGEAARAFTDSLLANELVHFSAAYDIVQDERIREEAARRGLRFETDIAQAIQDADWIISAVTADQSLHAAEAALDALQPGQVFIDINSVSPGRKQKTAALVAEKGAQYLDMAVMAPVHPRGHATPVLLAGEQALAIAPMLEKLGFQLEVVGDQPGEATAIKMVRSMFVKGLEALTVETALAASATGCFDRVIGSLADTFPGLGWPQNVNYMFERTLHHGLRRAAEMREVAATYDELGFTGALADKIADVQEKMGQLPVNDLSNVPLGEAVNQIVDLRLKEN